MGPAISDTGENTTPETILMDDWLISDLQIDVDSVLRGQGADPDVIRSRSPQLIELAERALSDAVGILKPQALVNDFEVLEIRHDALVLKGGQKISGHFVAGQLIGCKNISVAICTVGSSIDEFAEETMKSDLVYGLAVEGVGSAAVEALANAVCRKVDFQAKSNKYQTTIPLSPGMIGWDVREGQSAIFNLIEPSKINVELNQYCIMIPRKTLSMIIGTGPDLKTKENICDYCCMIDTCQYKTES